MTFEEKFIQAFTYKYGKSKKLPKTVTYGTGKYWGKEEVTLMGMQIDIYPDVYLKIEYIQNPDYYIISYDVNVKLEHVYKIINTNKIREYLYKKQDIIIILANENYEDPGYDATTRGFVFKHSFVNCHTMDGAVFFYSAIKKCPEIIKGILK